MKNIYISTFIGLEIVTIKKKEEKITHLKMKASVFEETNILKKVRSNAKKIQLSIEQHYIKQVNSKANSNHLHFSTDSSTRATEKIITKSSK